MSDELQARAERAEAALENEAIVTRNLKERAEHAEDESDRLRAELATKDARAERAEAECKALRKVLEPFAKLRVTRVMAEIEGLRYEFRVDAEWIRTLNALRGGAPPTEE
jgi:hypothetical protein